MHPIKSLWILPVIFWVMIGGVRDASALDFPLWDRFEASVKNSRTYANPFTDVTLKTTFTRPDGSTVNFWGFYDGDGLGGQSGDVWKFRFMPDQIGRWHYSCTFSDGAPCTSGTFNCVATWAKPGPLRVDPANPHWFMFSGGWRKHLHGYYYNDYWSDYEHNWNNIITNIVLPDGYTFIMAMGYIRDISTIGVNGNTYPTYAWLTRSGTVLFDRFDLATWRRLDTRLAWASDHNLVVYTFDGFIPQPDYGATRIPSDKEELYFRYTLARHAPFWNVWWNVGAELWKSYTSRQVVTWAQKIKDLDPWKHPISWHDQGQNGDTTFSHSASQADYAVLQDDNTRGIGFRRTTARETNNFVIGNYFAKPVYASEGSWWEGAGDTVAANEKRGVARRTLWGVSLASGINIYADWATDWTPPRAVVPSVLRRVLAKVPMLREALAKVRKSLDYGAGANNMLHYGQGLARQDVKRMNQFLSGVPWWTMEPHTELVMATDDVCLASIGRRYLVYSESGSTITLNLAAGTYEGEWFNPVDGATPASQAIAKFSWSGGGAKTFTVPSNFNPENLNEWVLHLWSDTTGRRAPAS